MPINVCDVNATGSKDSFLTQAPMSSTMGGFRPRTVITLDPEAWRSKTMISDSPFLFRRSTSACGELPSINLKSRAKSARYVTQKDPPIIMPRGSNMSVARFCDWTEDKSDCYSVSRLYREIANIPQSQTNGSPNNTNKNKINLNIASGSGTNSSALLGNSPNRSAFNSPGRMFVRDKKALTRGEREIIEGIYKNRSDVNAKDAISNLNYHVKSHQEAWRIGKLYVKNERSDIKLLVKSSGQQQQLQQQQQHQEHQRMCDTNEKSSSFEDSIPTTPKSVQADILKLNASIPLSSRLGNKFASTRKLMETSPFPKCSQCQLEQRGTGNQDLAKRAYLAHQQNQDNIWDSRPSAPPTTPDKPGRTDNCFHFGHSTSFEKKNVTSHRNNSEIQSPAQVTVVDPLSSPSSCSHRSSNSGDRSSSPRREGNATPRCSSKIQKTINIIHSVLEENSKPSSSGKQNSASSGFHSNECLQDLENSSDSGSDSESKRVRVKVYLPVADKDEHDDAMSESGIDASSVIESLGKDLSLDNKIRQC